MVQQCPKMNVKLQDARFGQARKEIYRLGQVELAGGSVGDKYHWAVLFKVEVMELLITKYPEILAKVALPTFFN